MANTDIFRNLPARIPARLLNVLNTLKLSVPILVKAIIGLLFLVNIRSWPLAWHIRVFRPVLYIRTRHFLLKLRVLLKSRKEKIMLEEKWVDSITPIGRNPFEMVVRYNSWSSLDDCDFYGHMSNSSYAKTLDAVRFKAAILMFPRIFTPEGWIALGETHYHYIREIPILSSYEVRLSIASWDQKWMYFVCKFVTKPNRKSKSQRKPTPSPNVPDATTNTLPTPSASGSSTPLISHNTSSTLKSIATAAISTEEPDGAILNAVTISTCCFKIGRITIPPVVVLALNGFTAPLSSTSSPSIHVEPYSHINPPPHWIHVQSLSCRSKGGSIKNLARFMRGGWKDVPENERWWDVALVGVEERRRVGLEGFVGLRRGMDVARAG